MAAATEQLRLPPYFPLVPKQCKDASKPFFDCFSDKSVYEEGKDPNVARLALQQCWDKLETYTSCAEKHLTAKQQTTWQAPQVYLEKSKG